jgi:4-hydroxybenzoate polyprenyltransferase
MASLSNPSGSNALEMGDAATPRTPAPPLLHALRPRQWTKNTIVFAGLIFAQRFTDLEMTLRAALCFVLFCLGSSGIYLINDLHDVREDRLHPLKRLRPIASGQVSARTAWIAADLLLIAALAGSWLLYPRPWVLVCVLIYAVKEVLYTYALKHVVIMDILINSIGFPLRAVAGIVAIQPANPLQEPVVISTWFLACIFFLSLFISVCKRRHELVLLQGDARAHRAVLAEYSPELLNQLVAMSTSATVICYALYTILKVPGSPGYMDPNHINPMIWTLPFVIFGIFRYLYLVYSREEGGAPEHLLLNDWWLLADVVAWLAVSVAVLGLS